MLTAAEADQATGLDPVFMDGAPVDPPASGSDVPSPAASGDGAGTPSTLDFVTFVVEGEAYAFPMERVGEIIRMPPTIRVPLGPPALVGLANLRGRVLPVVSLRSRCGLPEVEPDEATRVIVVVGEVTLGFVVDRVSSVTSVDVDRIGPAHGIGGATLSDLLSGLITADDEEGRLTKVLDVARLIDSQFELLGERVPPAGSQGSAAGASAAVRSTQGADEDVDDDTLELVSFAVDGQEYALPIDRVKEIVQAPEQVTTVPNAEPRVLGVMDLRGRLLPVVSLREVFGLPAAPLQTQNRIIVVQVPDDGAPPGSLVGVVMDTVREVLRVPRDLVADLPEFVARRGRAHEVDAICRLEQGKRLVSVLSIERMFAQTALREALRESVSVIDAGASREDDVMVDGQRVPVTPDAGTDELFVVFRLDAEEYGVDVDTVQEIIRVPQALIKVPQTLAFVEGLVNLRGAVLPVVDLRTRLGMDRCERDEQQRIIVLLVDGVRTGFIVDSVAEVLRVAVADLEPAPELSAELSRLVNRVANLPDSHRMLMLLEADQLVLVDHPAAQVAPPRDLVPALA